ncbi:MAG: hypothetical protein ACYC26_12375 [Phycisphaerales bacterium]
MLPAIIPIIPIIFIGFVVLIVISAIVSSKKAEDRRNGLLQWTAQSRLTFSAEKVYDFKDQYPMFQCLKAGDQDRYAYNLITGHFRGRDLIAFDYHYETTSTDSKGRRSTTSHHFSGVIIRPDIPLKPLHIRAEHLFDKLAGFFGYEDINFESAEFSRKFHVAGPDRKWAYDVLHARTMEFLLSRSRHDIQFDVNHIMIWSGSIWELDDMTEAIDTVCGVLDALPPYVVEQQKEPAHVADGMMP